MAGRFERFHAASGALLEAAGTTPLVVVLDDLHWADPASVELAASTPAGPAAAASCWSRPTATSRSRPVARSAGRSPGWRRRADLALGGLDAPEVAQVLARLTGGEPDPELGTSVHRRTGGNPFLVQQVARLLAAHLDAAA